MNSNTNTLTAIERRNIREAMSIWTNRIIEGNEIPIVVISMSSATSAPVLHKSAEYDNRQLKEFFQGIADSL